MTHEHLKNHLVNLYLIALSDGHFDPEELEVILKISEERGVSREEFEKTIVQPNVSFHIPNGFMERIQFLYDFVKVILADGKIEPEEERSFMQFCGKFGFESEESEELFNWLIEAAKKQIPTDLLEQEIERQIN
ncbi:hypothetical protein ACT4R9_05960 [Ornithobacterium rhinotracheale]|uniref:hypothetical protein n=1 Tax=Ornithobacterium rhinotracheale TaxID=28251 RepID=UPI003FA4B17E